MARKAKETAKKTPKKRTKAAGAPSPIMSDRITKLRPTISKELYKEIEFSFYAPLAQDVKLAGSFSDWQKKAIRLNPSETGHWKTKIRLKPGRYEYRYLIDGQWENDQRKIEQIMNAHGSANNVLVIS